MFEFKRDFFRLGLKCYEYGIVFRLGYRFRVIGKEVKTPARKVKPNLPLFTSGNPELAKECSELFGTGNSTKERTR